MVTFGDMEDILLQARMSLVRSTVSHQFSELSLSMLTCDWSIVRILVPDWSPVTDPHPGHHLLTLLLIKLHQTPHLNNNSQVHQEMKKALTNKTPVFRSRDLH